MFWFPWMSELINESFFPVCLALVGLKVDGILKKKKKVKVNEFYLQRLSTVKLFKLITVDLSGIFL